MNQRNAVTQAVMPIIALAIVIVFGVLGFILFSTLLLVCAAVGLVIYLIALVRLYFIKRQIDKTGEFHHHSTVIDVDYVERKDD